MADSRARGSMDARRLTFTLEPWLAAAAAFFLVAAAAAAAYPAFRADPWSAPGLILILGLAGVALMGVLAFWRAENPAVHADDAADLLEAMREPAALAPSRGRLLRRNPAWIAAGGPSLALPGGRAAPALYVAFAEA